ncbi:MAG: ABC transporter substrate-binding protein, partial [Clostridia bacterium]|nr:ABC transporter substrate-binding protein [Clostridia bacterium]
GTKDVPTVFGQLTQRDGSFLVSRKQEPNFEWTNLKGKELLVGRRGGVPAMTFEYILKEKGFTESDININYGVEFNLMTAAFAEGTADYCTMFEPTASEFQASGKGYIVASVGEAGGDIPYTSYIAKRSWLNKHEDTVNGFLRAMLKAVDYVQSNTPETIAPLLEKHFPSTSVESITVSIRNYQKINSWATDMAMTEESFERLQNIMETAGELETRGKFTDLVDNSYVKAIYASLS